MKKFNNILCLIGLIALLVSCERDVPYTNTDIVFLGHKGAGGNTINTTTPENTLAAVQSAARLLDGAEIDVQLSKDGTIWLQHNYNVNDYNKIQGLPPAFIPLMSDADIAKIEISRGTLTSRLYQLSEIIDYWNSQNRNFYLSLDVKDFVGEKLSDGSSVYSNYPGGQEAYFKNFAAALNSTLKAGPFDKLMLEFNSSHLIAELAKQSVAKDVTTFLSYESSDQTKTIEKAQLYGYDGISWNYKLITPAMLSEAKAKGFKINLYTGSYLSEVREILDMKPDIIQTDVITAKEDLYLR